MGRNLKLIAEDFKKIEKLTSQGLSVASICKNLNISRPTFYKYKNEAPEKDVKSTSLIEYYTRGKKKAIETVENVLFQKATGQIELKEEIKEVIIDIKTGKQTFIKITTKVKRVAPDTASMIFFLTNRTKKRWKNRDFNKGNDQIKLPKGMMDKIEIEFINDKKDKK